MKPCWKRMAGRTVVAITGRQTRRRQADLAGTETSDHSKIQNQQTSIVNQLLFLPPGPTASQTKSPSSASSSLLTTRMSQLLTPNPSPPTSAAKTSNAPSRSRGFWRRSKVWGSCNHASLLPCNPPPQVANSRRCPMNKIPTTQPDPLDQMSEEYRKIRSNQPSRSSAEMRAQLERNRLDYAEKPQPSSERARPVG